MSEITHWIISRHGERILTRCGLWAYAREGTPTEFDTSSGGRIGATAVQKQATCLRCTR